MEYGDIRVMEHQEKHVEPASDDDGQAGQVNSEH